MAKNTEHNCIVVHCQFGIRHLNYILQRSLHFYCVSVVNLSFQVIMLLSVKVKNKNGNVIKGWTIITCQEDSTFEDLLHLAHPDLNDGRIYNLVQVKVGKAADSCLNCVQDHLLNVKEVIDMFGLFVEIQVEEEDAVEGTALFFLHTQMDLYGLTGYWRKYYCTNGSKHKRLYPSYSL